MALYVLALLKDSVFTLSAVLASLPLLVRKKTPKNNKGALFRNETAKLLAFEIQRLSPRGR